MEHNIDGDIMYLIKRIYHLIMDKKIPTLAGSLTFFLVLNGGSFLFLYITISNYLPNSFIDIFINELDDGKLKEFINYFFNYQNNLSYSLFLIASSIFSSSSLYYHLMHVSELVGGKHLNLSISKRMLAIILTLLFLLILHIITFCSTYLMMKLKNYSFYILLITLFIVFLLIIFVINLTALRTISIKRVIKGSGFSVIYFLLFSIGFIIYIKIFSNFKIVYGVLSFLVILMFYMYILSIGLVIGIYINCKNLDVFKFITSKK